MGGVGLRGEGVCGGIAGGSLCFVQFAFSQSKMPVYLILKWASFSVNFRLFNLSQFKF